MKNYHEILGLDREPFGNSPDPDFFHSSPRHAECLRRLEIAVRLRRGLCVVTGEVGTGKTTLCRRLIRTLSYDQAVSAHLLPDPSYEDPRDFLAAVAVSFGIRVDGEDAASRIREAIQEYLLAEAADGDRIVVLCVDEGQKITGACLEILRELLNFETNTRKLMQIVIFAQNEFEGVLGSRLNLSDRVNTRLRLKPLSFAETKRLIRTRLRLAAGDSWREHEPALFTRAAMYAIHRASNGYPRRVMRLCHATLLETVGREKSRAGLAEVRAARKAGGMGGGLSWRAAAVAALPVAAALVILLGPGRERTVELLDTSLLRVGEVVSKAPDALTGVPGYEAVRGLITSLDEMSLSQMLDAASAALVKDEPATPAATAEAAPEAAPAATAEAPAGAEPASVQVEAPAAPAPAPAAVPETPRPASAPAQALAAAGPSPAVPQAQAVAEQAAAPRTESSFPEMQRLVPQNLSLVSNVVQASARPGLTAESEPVVIEIPAAPAAIQPVVAQAPVQPTVQPTIQPVAQPVTQPVVQAVTAQPAAPAAVQPVVAQVSVQPTVQPTIQPVAQPVAQPVVQAVAAQPAAPAAIQPVVAQAPVQAAVQPTIQPVAQPVAQPVVQAVTAQPAAPVAVQPVVAQAPVQAAVQPTIQPVAQPVTQPVVQAVAAQPVAPVAAQLTATQVPVQPAVQPTIQPVAQPVVQAMAQPAVPAASAVVPAPVAPRILGEVVVQPGWSLSKAAYRLYGNGGKQIMSVLAAANPDISDMDMVRPGHKVIFPARQVEPLPSGACVAVLGRYVELSMAFNSLSALRPLVPQTVLFAHYSPREGLFFDVVLDRYHPDAASAQRALTAIPREVASRAVVVEFSDQQMVAYSVLNAAGPTDSPKPITTVAQNAVTAP